MASRDYAEQLFQKLGYWFNDMDAVAEVLKEGAERREKARFVGEQAYIAALAQLGKAHDQYKLYDRLPADEALDRWLGTHPALRCDDFHSLCGLVEEEAGQPAVVAIVRREIFPETTAASPSFYSDPSKPVEGEYFGPSPVHTMRQLPGTSPHISMMSTQSIQAVKNEPYPGSVHSQAMGVGLGRAPQMPVQGVMAPAAMSTDEPPGFVTGQNYKGILNEHCQATHSALPQYETTRVVGTAAHVPTFSSTCRMMLNGVLVQKSAGGCTKKAAELHAAFLAYNEIQQRY